MTKAIKTLFSHIVSESAGHLTAFAVSLKSYSFTVVVTTFGGACVYANITRVSANRASSANFVLPVAVQARLYNMNSEFSRLAIMRSPHTVLQHSQIILLLNLTHKKNL
jgi:hypothetical protein